MIRRLEGVYGRITLHGSLDLPCSKSDLQRRLLCAALASGESTLYGQSHEFETLADDLWDAVHMAESLGAQVDIQPSQIVVRPHHHASATSIALKASATTLRLSIPLLLTLDHKVTITGSEQLAKRSLDAYARCFATIPHLTATFDAPHGLSLPLTLSGSLIPGHYLLDCSQSSQFASGLLIALPLLSGPSILEIGDHLASAGYFAMTARCLNDAGIQLPDVVQQLIAGQALSLPCKLSITGRQTFAPVVSTIERDLSSAAFWHLAQAIQGGQILLMNIEASSHSLQPDSVVTTLITSAPDIIDCDPIPDLIPCLSVWTAVRSGHITRFDHAARLRGKETDRLESTVRLLTTLGCKVDMSSDSFTVHPIKAFSGGSFSANGDHRMVMAATLASLASVHPIYIEDAAAVAKSYPLFWRDFEALGGESTLIMEP